MKNLIREVKVRKKQPLWKIIFLILGAVVIINKLITMSNSLGATNAAYVSLVILAIAIGVCAYIMIKLISNYTYTLVDDELVFERNIGKREDLLLTVNMSELEWVMPYKKANLSNKVAYTYKFVCSRNHDEYFVSEFQRGPKRYRLIFSPSEKMLSSIMENIQKA